MAATAVMACGGGESGSTPTTAPSKLTASIEGTCRLAEVGSEIALTYKVELAGSGQITQVRLLVDGVSTEESGRIPQRTYSREATVKVPDRTAHTFQVVAEAGSARATASTTIPCAAPTPGRGL